MFISPITWLCMRICIMPPFPGSIEQPCWQLLRAASRNEFRPLQQWRLVAVPRTPFSSRDRPRTAKGPPGPPGPPEPGIRNFFIMCEGCTRCIKWTEKYLLIKQPLLAFYRLSISTLKVHMSLTLWIALTFFIAVRISVSIALAIIFGFQQLGFYPLLSSTRSDRTTEALRILVTSILTGLHRNGKKM